MNELEYFRKYFESKASTFRHMYMYIPLPDDLPIQPRQNCCAFLCYVKCKHIYDTNTQTSIPGPYELNKLHRFREQNHAESTHQTAVFLAANDFTSIRNFFPDHVHLKHWLQPTSILNKDLFTLNAFSHTRPKCTLSAH